MNSGNGDMVMTSRKRFKEYLKNIGEEAACRTQ